MFFFLDFSSLEKKERIVSPSIIFSLFIDHQTNCISHMAPFSLISQRLLSSEHDQSQQPNMLAYGRFKKKIVKNSFFV